MNSKDGINRSLTSTNKWTYVPGKVFPLTPLNIQDIKKQLLESSHEIADDLESDDTEKASESSDCESVPEGDKAEIYETNNYKITSSHLEEQDTILNNITKTTSYLENEREGNKYTQKITDQRIKKCNLNIKEHNSSHKYLSFRSSLEPVCEDTLKCVEEEVPFNNVCDNKENVSDNLEPLNLSKDTKKIEDSFDLDLSALSLHTPVKKKEKNFNYATPKINIIPPSETKSVHKTGSLFKTPNVSKNPYALKKLFKTPINKPLMGTQFSAAKRQQGTPYQSTRKHFSSQQSEASEICESKISTQAVSFSKWDEFDRITVNNTEYIVMNLLGRGGSSEVFHCFNAEEKAHVAIKLVSLTEPATAESYINEVKLLKSLQGCDRIIKMYDYEIRDEKLMVVLENGAEDLSAILKDLAKRQSHLPLYMLIYYWMEMLYAVKQIHSNGVIHSDLKPANFLRANSGLKLIDFGIASKVQEDMTCVYKSNQEGSCNYISPEALNVQTNGNVDSPSYGKPKYKVHFKSDVWSLGCILYQLVYRKTPFQHLNPIWAKLGAIIDPKHKIDYPHAEWAPVRIVDTIKRCLQYDIKSRPSVDELLEEYEQLLRI